MQDWEQLAGGTLLVGIEGTQLDPTTCRRLSALGPAGAILFSRNLERIEQTCELLDALRGAIRAAEPLFAIDQEGGRVSRLGIWVGPTPSAAQLARAGEGAARRFGSATGRALRVLGFNVDFAPVVDLCEPDAPNGIGDRSFGIEPASVIALAGSFLEGLQDAGIAGSLKHFPGLGATGVDSHEQLPAGMRDRAGMECADLAPFQQLAPFAASVMVGHAHYPAFDDAPDRPASLSPAIIAGLLRGKLGYRGLVVSDDLDMGAVAPLDIEGAGAVRAIEAGCDLLLYCRRLERAESAAAALAERARRDRSFGDRLRDAAAAVERFAVRWPAKAPDPSQWEPARRAMVEATSGVTR